MKSSDKRKVPGLEDCSSDSEDDDTIPFKKPFVCNDSEIEVHSNGCLKEEPKLLTNKTKKFNNIWGNIVQENILDETFNKVGVNRMNVRRSVESYSVDHEDHPTRKRKQARPKNGCNMSESKPSNVKNRIEARSYNKNKDRSHININPNADRAEQVVLEIARLLNEQKIDLITRCVNILGIEKCLEVYYMTEDIEDGGGLLVVSGNRRRTAGGVFLTLIKESDQIDAESKRLIFDCAKVTRQSPIAVTPTIAHDIDTMDTALTVKNDDDVKEDMEEGEID